MLDKATLKASLKQAFVDQENKTTNLDAVLDDLCTKISAAIDMYVKGAQINYTTGLTAPNGPVTGTFGGNLS
ncbi:MAG: hypothetical protein EPN37_04545 [Chitinophagaceae bacterium]|nr:MAG: hypothetical protein EPN37_04545 [Chitinophagaceae bacterium]